VEGGEVPLIRPPQGGKVLFISVLVRNVSSGPIQLTASLANPCSDRLLTVEDRPVVFHENADGWGEPVQPTMQASFSNIAACPAANAQRDIDGAPHRVSIEFRDQLGRTGAATAMVIPVCAEPEFLAECQCECDSEYGETCPTDPDGGMECPPDASE